MTDYVITLTSGNGESGTAPNLSYGILAAHTLDMEVGDTVKIVSADPTLYAVYNGNATLPSSMALNNATYWAENEVSGEIAYLGNTPMPLTAGNWSVYMARFDAGGQDLWVSTMAITINVTLPMETITLETGHTYLITTSHNFDAISLSGNTLSVSANYQFDLIDLGKGNGTDTARVIVAQPSDISLL